MELRAEGGLTGDSGGNDAFAAPGLLSRVAAGKRKHRNGTGAEHKRKHSNGNTVLTWTADPRHDREIVLSLGELCTWRVADRRDAA